MPSFWEVESALEEYRVTRKTELAERSRIITEQAKLAVELTDTNTRLADAVAEIALLEVELGEKQRKVDAHFKSA